MLRASDLLLTLAAVFLLNAALKSSAKTNRFTLASANQVMQSQTSDTERELYAPDARQGDQMHSIDHWMSKIKRNLKQKEQDDRSNFAINETTQPRQKQQDGQQVSQYKRAHEVKVDFLRSNTSPNDVTNSIRNTQNTTSSSNTLYLLNYLLPQLKTSRADEPTSALPEVNSNELFDSSEQQQPPPFTLFPQQPANGIPAQFQQQLQQQLQQQQQPAIRQMLSNYQRYPQSRPVSDHQRQLHTQLEPRPPALHLRPPTQAPALGLAGLNQNTQQPLSPLQLLAGPFQAFLPGLGGQQQHQQQQPASRIGHSQQSAKAKHDGGDESAAKTPASPSPSPQQPNPFGAFLNPFNLQPPPAANSNAQQQQQPAAQAGMPNLQSFYQQLPLYQALLAARQRQEALQAAEKMRLQQQQQVHPNGHNANTQPIGIGQLALTPPSSDNNGVTPPPFARLPPGAFGLPGQTLPLPNANPTPNQPLLNPFVQNQQVQQLQPQLPQTPYSPPPAPTLTQPPANQAHQPTSNQNGPVQFDDDQPADQQPQQPVPQQPPHQPPPQVNDNQEKDNGHNNEDNNNGSQNDGNQGDDHQNQGHSQDQGGHEQDNQAGKPAEEEDPDLKSFQNLANGGDSFTDLFPKGILSDGDINEIKTQQAEQAKKQEEEERQKHMRQQQQHQQQQQQQQQQYNNQPVNQFVGNNIDTGNNQNVQQPNSNEQQDQNVNNQAQPEQEGGNQEGNDQQDDGNQGDGQEGGEGEGEGDGQEEDAPTAAALTAKSASNEKLKGRWTKSPGVEYSRV